MKRMFIWLKMLFKRQMKKISIYMILLFMVGCAFFIRHIAVNFQVNINIGVMNQDIQETDETGQDKRVAERILNLMKEQKGLVKFTEYTDEEELRNDVRTSKVYAGYIFQKDFWEKIKDRKLKDAVLVIATEDSIVPKLVNELVFSYIMQEYSYDLLLYDTYETGYFEKEDQDQVAEDLRKYYEEYSSNGSTFSLLYSGVKEVDHTVKLDVFDYISPMIKGIIGVMIFLAGLCGTLILYQDKKNGTFSRFTPLQTVSVSMAEIFIPAFITGIVGNICLILTGLYTGSLPEWIHTLLYIIFVTIYCFVLNELIRNRVLFMAMIPVFLMASLLFCHVFVNLNAIVPEFRYISFLLPPNYF